MDKKKNPELHGLRSALLIGILFFPVFFILDVIVYPEYKFALLLIRTGIVVLLTGIYLVTYNVNAKYLYILMLILFVSAGFSISLMCYITGEGFSSPYFSGLFLVLITPSLFFRISTQRYVFLMGAICIQHFVLLSFLPFSLQDIMTNMFFLGSFSLIAVITHKIVYNLVQENTFLKDFLPICANCKKIRDEAGNWNKLETYMKDHSQVKFTHGLCPDCVKKLYGMDIE